MISIPLASRSARLLTGLALCFALTGAAFAEDPAPAQGGPAAGGSTTSATATPAAPPPATARVVSVYDGDTFTLDTGDRVRLRTVNTPELKPYEEMGDEARDAAQSFLINKQVTLIYGDPVRDHYGRLLAGAKVGDADLALYLVDRGLAHIFLVGPADGDIGPLLAAQAKARAAKLGIWKTDRFQGTLHITSFHANGRGDDRENLNGEYLRVCNITTEPLDLKGYKITDIQGNAWNLPAMTVPGGGSFEIHSGVGTNETDPTKPLVVYLGNDAPVWNNDKDRATLLDAAGKIQDVRDHEVKSRQN